MKINFKDFSEKWKTPKEFEADYGRMNSFRRIDLSTRGGVADYLKIVDDAAHKSYSSAQLEESYEIFSRGVGSSFLNSLRKSYGTLFKKIGEPMSTRFIAERMFFCNASINPLYKKGAKANSELDKIRNGDREEILKKMIKGTNNNIVKHYFNTGFDSIMSGKVQYFEGVRFGVVKKMGAAKALGENIKLSEQYNKKVGEIAQERRDAMVEAAKESDTGQLTALGELEVANRYKGSLDKLAKKYGKVNENTQKCLGGLAQLTNQVLEDRGKAA